MFAVVGMIMRLAPIAAFGAMAFTVGKYGLGSIVSLGKLMGTMYLTCFLFVVVVLGVIARLSGFSLWKFLKYIKDEIFTVLGTSSSESVVPQLMRKLEHAGVSKPVVGLVVPSGVTFNPDGQCIYYTMAAIFIAQATNTPLTLTDQLVVLGVLLLTSKGSAGVTGSGFITLAATLASMGKIPVAGHGAAAGRRPLHVRGARHHQHDRQRGRHGGHRPLGRRGRPRAPGAGARRQDRSGGSARAVRGSAHAGSRAARAAFALDRSGRRLRRAQEPP